MKTRTAPKGESSGSPAPHMKRQLPANDPSPWRLLIASSKIGERATVMTFPHPRTKLPTRYYVCPESGTFEFRQLPTASSPTSWLLQTRQSPSPETQVASTGPGYVSKSCDVYTVTPVDPLFLLLPALEKQAGFHGKKVNRQMLCTDDLLEETFESSQHLKSVFASPLAKMFEHRLSVVCETVVVDDVVMYRLNDEKLFQELLSKARRLATAGLPPSLEEKFVRRPLEMPVFAMTLAAAADESFASDQSAATSQSTSDSQTTAADASSADSQESARTGITTPDVQGSDTDNYKDIRDLQRLKIAYTFIVSSYFCSSWEKFLLGKLVQPDSGVNFGPLEQRLGEIAKVREEALAARNLAEYSRKRGLEDDEAAAERAEKRSKQEEEERRRKANESRGVRELKKVNTSGMKKMSDFFKKLPAK